MRLRAPIYRYRWYPSRIPRNRGEFSAVDDARSDREGNDLGEASRFDRRPPSPHDPERYGEDKKEEQQQSEYTLHASTRCNSQAKEGESRDQEA